MTQFAAITAGCPSESVDSRARSAKKCAHSASVRLDARLRAEVQQLISESTISYTVKQYRPVNLPVSISIPALKRRIARKTL
jgi:hypothetical protein